MVQFQLQDLQIARWRDQIGARGLSTATTLAAENKVYFIYEIMVATSQVGVVTYVNLAGNSVSVQYPAGTSLLVEPIVALSVVFDDKVTGYRGHTVPAR